jgi:hypothetical protein
MKVTYKSSIPIQQKVDRITNTLNSLTDVSATSEFITEIPRHYLITIEVPEDTTYQDLLELGALCGALDND